MVVRIQIARNDNSEEEDYTFDSDFDGMKRPLGNYSRNPFSSFSF